VTFASSSRGYGPAATPRIDACYRKRERHGKDLTAHLTSENRLRGIGRAVVGFWQTYGPVMRPLAVIVP
jgi:hypothetical protein